MILMHTLNPKIANASLIVTQIGIVVVLIGFGILQYKVVASGSLIVLIGIVAVDICFSLANLNTHEKYVHLKNV